MARQLSPKKMAEHCLAIIENDRDRLEKIERYMKGEHDWPYMPDRADDEYKILAQRAVTNITEFIVGAPVQCMYVDSFRRGDPQEVEANGTETIQPEWRHWQNSRLDSLQHQIYRGAFGFGHSFTVTEKDKKQGRVLTRGLSPMRTTAVYEFPASDDNPLYALTIISHPYTQYHPATNAKEEKEGVAYLWDQDTKYRVTFGGNGGQVKAKSLGKHGARECPVTRFAGVVDLEGETHGIVEPMIPLQDRLNQQVFDLLVDGTYNSFQIRTISGMVPPVKTKAIREFPDGDGPKAVYKDGELVTPDYGDVVGSEPVIDPDTGQEIPMAIDMNPRRWLIAPDENTKFGSLEGTPMEGFIQAIKMTMEQISALSQTPPHYMLGEIANLSAEALQSAEKTLLRKVAEFQSSFGESWERVFRIASALDGDPIGTDDYSGEVIWRDVGSQSLVLVGDSLAKMAQGLEVPPQALWAEVPGMTAQKLAQWKQMAEERDSKLQLVEAQQRASRSLRPDFREPSTQAPTTGAQGATESV